MSSTDNNPSINPADNYSLVGTLQFAFNKMLQSVNGMLPAQIISYDRATNRAEVQILITILTTNGSQVPRPTVASVPVLLMGGGNYFLSFPLKVGDYGWIFASDRDISLFLQSYSQSPPNTVRVKNFSDGLFIPDVMTGYTINSEDDNNFVIQSLDGTTKIAVGDDAITIESGTLININAPSISMDLGLATNILNVNGSIVATGTITP